MNAAHAAARGRNGATHKKNAAHASQPLSRSSTTTTPRTGPIAVKAAVLTIVERLAASGASKLYTGNLLATPGAALYALSTIAALDVLHDAWFYWTHRALHARPVYRAIHASHHASTSPTPFTGYSFHVVEAAIVFANEILVCFLFPIHAGLHRAYHLFTTVIHCGGHAGYEMSPFVPSVAGAAVAALEKVAPRTGARARSFLNTVQHHDIHHRFPSSHFSLYFTFWDALCGTEHPGYRAIVAPAPAAAADAPAKAVLLASAARSAAADKKRRQGGLVDESVRVGVAPVVKTAPPRPPSRPASPAIGAWRPRRSARVAAASA